MRVKGYYWVKETIWSIKYWNETAWMLHDCTVDDDYFSEIDEKQITRESYWKKRCELAEIFIDSLSNSGDATPNEIRTWKAWDNFIRDEVVLNL